MKQVDPTRFQVPVGVTTTFYDTRGDVGVVFCLQGSLNFSQTRKWFPSGLFTSQALLLILPSVCFAILILRISWSCRHSSFHEPFILYICCHLFYVSSLKEKLNSYTRVTLYQSLFQL